MSALPAPARDGEDITRNGKTQGAPDLDDRIAVAFTKIAKSEDVSALIVEAEAARHALAHWIPR